MHFFMLRKDSFYLNLHTFPPIFCHDERYVTFKNFNGFKSHINHTKSILSCVLLLEGTDIEVNYLCLTQSPKTFVEKSWINLKVCVQWNMKKFERYTLLSVFSRLICSFVPSVKMSLPNCTPVINKRKLILTNCPI